MARRGSPVRRVVGAAVLAALAVGVGCDATTLFEGALPVAGVEESILCSWDGSPAAALHVTADAEAQTELLAYFDDVSDDWSPNGCEGETPDQTRARSVYAVVAGEHWVLTTHPQPGVMRMMRSPLPLDVPT